MESRKIAIYKSRKHAAIQCAVHVVPVLAVMTVVGINLREYYIGGELSGESGQDSEKLGALQFAAKLHELLMIASIGAIVFTSIRKELAFGDGLPFGAVFAGLAVDSISTLWSMEFWSTILHAWSKTVSRRRSKWYLVALLFVSILLGASVGPSTANLMRPRMGDWDAGGTKFWIGATSDELYPTQLRESPDMEYCLSTLNDASCPYGDYEVIARDYMSFWPTLEGMDDMPESTYVSGRHAQRQMSFRARSIDNGSRAIWPNAYTLATVGPAAVADSLGYIGGLWAYAAANAKNKRNFRFRNNANFAVDAISSVVSAYCAPHTISNSTFNDTMWFANLDSVSIDNGETTWDTSPTEYWTTFNSTTLSISRKFVTKNKIPGVLWLEDDDLRTNTRGTLNAVVLPPQTMYDSPTYYCCSIDSRQGLVSLAGERNTPKSVVGAPNGWTITGTRGLPTQIYPSPTWARYVNPEIKINSTSGDVTSPFIALTNAAGMGLETPRAPLFQAGYIVESVLASMLANGIARWSYNMSLAGELRGMNDPIDLWAGGKWATELLPNRPIGGGGQAFKISDQEREDSTEFILAATVNGYAYSWHGAVQITAIVVLLIYASLATYHTIYSCATGIYSGCWDTAPEIAVLALNSESTDFTKNTGAGIGTMGTYKKSIHVVTKSGHLEIVPSDQRIASGGARIKRGDPYG